LQDVQPFQGRETEHPPDQAEVDPLRGDLGLHQSVRREVVDTERVPCLQFFKESIIRT
jgi:hypothetical protein